MIDREIAKKLLWEHQHSMAVLIGFVGSTTSHVNQLLLKWPDLIDAFLQDDKDKFDDDIADLICHPIYIVASVLIQKASLEKIITSDEFTALQRDIAETKLTAYKSVLDAKANLIRISNNMIFKLKNVDHAMEYIK
jgi:hypothetical protein